MSAAAAPLAPTDLVERLRQPQSARGLLDVLFDFLLDQPIGDLLEEARIFSAIERALDAPWVAQVISQRVEPTILRVLARAQERPEERVGHWLDAESEAALRHLAQTPRPLPPQQVRRFLGHQQVRTMLQQFVEDTLARFISTFKPGGEGGGLAGAVGRGAFGFASRLGGGIVSGVGEQIEAQLKRAASTFVQTSMPALIEHIVGQLTHRQAAERQAQIQVSLLEQLLQSPIAPAAQWSAEKLDFDALRAHLPRLIAHNLQREALRADLRAEIQAQLDVLRAQPVRSLLEESHWAAIHADLQHFGPPLLARFAQSAGFLQWLAQPPTDEAAEPTV